MFQKRFFVNTKEKTLYQFILRFKKFQKKLLKFFLKFKKDYLNRIINFDCSLKLYCFNGLNTFYDILIKILRQNMYNFQVINDMNKKYIFKLRCFCLQSRPP